ncbi:MAG: hypothetical protein L3K14_08030 [Thermoplasmata archaeon]|nr:hypothetical protein [Thermoplasmata archaeon]
MSAPTGQPMQPYNMYATGPSQPSRPIGVSILAVLMGIVGALFVIGGVLLAVLGLGLGLTVPAFGLTLGVTVLGIVLLILGLIILGLALGLWHQRLWALVLAIIIFALNFLSDAVAGAYFSLGAIVSILLVIYLIAVHRHFL